MSHDHMLCMFYIKQITSSFNIWCKKNHILKSRNIWTSVKWMKWVKKLKPNVNGAEWAHTQNNMNICTVVVHLYLACKANNKTVLVRDIPAKGFSCEKPFFRAAFLAESYQREGEAIYRCREYGGKEDKGQRNVSESWERAMVWMKGEGETERVFHGGRGLLLVGGV